MWNLCNYIGLVWFYKLETMDIIDRLCRLTDGASITKYTLFQFLELFNQNILYSIMQPKQPNDIALFPQWQTQLKNSGVEIVLNANVLTIKDDIVTTSENTYHAKNIILAVPPKNIADILVRSNINTRYYGKYNTFHNTDDFLNWATQSTYIDYIPITFHWDEKQTLDKIYGGITDSKYGLVFTVMSDYMHFTESQTVISCLITKPELVTDRKNIISDTFQQLKLTYPNIPMYKAAIVSHNDYDSSMPTDTAFVLSTHGYGPITCDIPNLYFLGCFNSNSNYSFTSLESAVSNAMHMANLLENKHIRIQSFMTIKQIIKIIIGLSVIICLILFTMKYFSS